MKKKQFTMNGLKNEIARIDAYISTTTDHDDVDFALEEREAYEDAIANGYAFHRGYKIALGTSNALFDENGNFLHNL